MNAIDIIRNRSQETSRPESFDKQFANQMIRYALEAKYGPSDTAKIVTGVVVGGFGGLILYHLLFRKKRSL